MEGFGADSRTRTAKILRLAEDLPIGVEIGDRANRIEAFLSVLDEMVQEGMMTLEKVRITAYRAGGGSGVKPWEDEAPPV